MKIMQVIVSGVSGKSPESQWVWNGVVTGSWVGSSGCGPAVRLLLSCLTCEMGVLRGASRKRHGEPSVTSPPFLWKEPWVRVDQPTGAWGEFAEGFRRPG